MKLKHFYLTGIIISILWITVLFYLGITTLCQQYWWGIFFILAGIFTARMEYQEKMPQFVQLKNYYHEKKRLSKQS